MMVKEIIKIQEKKTDTLEALELEEYIQEEEAKFLLKNNIKSDLVVGKLLGIKKAIEIVKDLINKKYENKLYILTCTCGSAEIEKMDNPNMFWCHSCGEKLHETELVITTLNEYYER